MDILNIVQSSINKPVYTEPYEILQLYTDLLKAIRHVNCNINININSIIPMPRYSNAAPFIHLVNQLLHNLAFTTPRTIYIDTHHIFLDLEGQPIAELYKDNVHPSHLGTVKIIRALGQCRDLNTFMQKKLKSTIESSLTQQEADSLSIKKSNQTQC